MEQLKKFLSDIGFRKNEIDIYTALLMNGTSSVLQIAKITHMHRSNIYDSLRVLVRQGLVYTVNNPTRLFEARDPKSLVHYLKRREIELHDLLKHYENPRTKFRDMSLVRVSQGTLALREAVHSLLEGGKEICVFGVSGRAPEIIGPMLQDFHKERAHRKILMRHIYNTQGAERVKYLNTLKYTEARILPAKYDSAATTSISGDKVVIFLWDNDITVIEMNDPEIARTYANYFEILWHKAKVVE